MVSPPPCPRTRRLPGTRSTPASTCSSRSRSPSRWPTPRPWRPPRPRAGASLMVGHLLEYHPGLVRLKELVDSGELGDVHYIYGNRLNLGKLRADENALWSLGAHDVSVVLRLAERGAARVPRLRRVVHAATGSRTWSSASCASRPAWPRTCTSRGSTRTRSAASRSSARAGWPPSTTWRSTRSSPSTTRASTSPTTATGSTSRAPATSGRRSIPNDEPLRLECSHFVECVREGRQPLLRR